MKVLFLDVDGVLNGYNTRQTVFGWTFVDDDKIENLKQIIDATGADIVLSSTWRICKDDPKEHNLYNKLCDKLAEHGLFIMDVTPQLPGVRGVEIKAWLDAHPEYTEFVILDDDNDMQPIGKYLVQTGLLKGLEQKHVDMAIKILNEGV